MSKMTYKFSGHQTFVFRYGWLEKGVRGVAEHADLFARDDALVLLGVGKNMVESIKHWCQVAQLIELVQDGKRNPGRFFQPTAMARRLLLDGGWDPYLQDDASLWLIHWLIVTNPSICTSWQLVFSRFGRPDFTHREIENYVLDFTERESLRVGPGVVKRDVDCLIRMYSASPASKSKPGGAETFDCPLLQLNLIQPSPDGELYRFAIGHKPTLPAAVFAFALHEYFSRRQGRTETLSVQECLYGESSPGQVFKLDENSLIEYVEELEDSLGDCISLDETAGLKQLYRRRAYDPMQVLSDYYSGVSPK